MTQGTLDSTRPSGEIALNRLRRFWAKPWDEKATSLRFRTRRMWDRASHSIPFPVRMSEGYWWIPWNDVIRDAVLNCSFEPAERRFVGKYLQPGMTVLDVGAYFGIYTLLASLTVGTNGKVIAFEPSPAQMRKLRLHLMLNRCRNVRVANMALSSTEGESRFFMVTGRSAGLSSLRSPNVDVPTRSIRVPVMTLDGYLQRNSLSVIDFMKIDVEGGELDLLKGAVDLLNQRMRPVILCELQNARTEPWGYQARDAAAFVENFGFRWFTPAPDGKLVRLPENSHYFDGNYVAVPEERLGQIGEQAKNESRA